METIVLKFGGSSLADNEKLSIVAKKIIDFYNQNKKVVVVVSAQGKTTDNLISEATEIAQIPNKREMDVLLSTGEQVSIAKLSILLNSKGYNAISLTGWQAGIHTSKSSQNARIKYIDTTRITNELNNNKIVIVAGFQGIDEDYNITTLGRGGSDTTAVAVAAALDADHCYIFSDVEGIYTADPNIVHSAKKIDNISYMEMLDLSNEGAKVLHNRCIEIAKEHHIQIETGSTFNSNLGTVISERIEDTSIKSIILNDNIYLISIKKENKLNYKIENFSRILFNHQIKPLFMIDKDISICFVINSSQLLETEYVLKNCFNSIKYNIENISKLSIIGFGISNNINIVLKVYEILESYNIKILAMETDECKISIIMDKKIECSILSDLHNKLIV